MVCPFSSSGGVVLLFTVVDLDFGVEFAVLADEARGHRGVRVHAFFFFEALPLDGARLFHALATAGAVCAERARTCSGIGPMERISPMKRIIFWASDIQLHG
jgi:hypothetical protein